MKTALNRFISWSADQCRPFFQLLHKWKDFSLTEECDRAFGELKEYLSNPLVLSCLGQEEVLYAYLVVTNHAISLVLIWVDSGVQRRMYYVRKSLKDAEMRYSHVEKAVLALIHATKKLSHYFQEAVGVFAAEISPPWTVYTDEATNHRGSGVGVGVVSPNGIVLEKSLKLSFLATNNEAKYKALWSRLEAVKGLEGNSIEVFSDSQLIVGQVLGEYEVKDVRTQAYLGKIKQFQAHF
ncbi:uncharacterized protein LOC142608825 [Castanea sativa]|uniref:uncharacterized protein LOC142608825 n=1 Tax=Castanea sativa TaxID=21020 RepID=UPI003F64FA34